MKTKNWTLATRLLHLGLVGTVSAQLFISLVMVAPDHKGSEFGRLAFEAHEVVGLTALAIVLLHWIWTLVSHADGGLQHLFPWFGNDRKQVVRQARNIFRGKLPNVGERGGLAGFVHGLGLLAVTGIAITGGALFVLFPENGEPGALAESFAGMHEALATLVWAYWAGHGAMAIAHHFLGHDVTRKMFSLHSDNEKEEHTVDAKLI